MQDYSILFDRRKTDIIHSKDQITISGTKYYVSKNGDDTNDGLTPNTAWKTLNKVSDFPLSVGDGVFFERGWIFRGRIDAKNGVTYAAYGNGDKPKLYGSEMSLANPNFWEIYDTEKNIWKCTKKLMDVGTLVFNGESLHSRKLIPSYKNGKFVCRDNENKEFAIKDNMTQDLDIFWLFDEKMTTKEVNGESFPIPDVSEYPQGDIYLRCDKGNPGKVFYEIEALSAVNMFRILDKNNVTIDNLCIKYVGRHGIGAGGYCIGLHVTNCEFGWIGGVIQTYEGTDPNFPWGKRGSVTRYGNAIQIYGGCDDFYVANNYIYEVYDAGITHQITTSKKITMTNITYRDNIIEKCVYGIEYFLNQIDGETESYMDNVQIFGNFIRLTGYGWGRQRHNTDTPAAIKSWNFCNTAKNFCIYNNIFDRSAYKLLHLVSARKAFCPILKNNTYIQNLGGIFGLYGENHFNEPGTIYFYENIENIIKNFLGDSSGIVLFAK